MILKEKIELSFIPQKNEEKNQNCVGCNRLTIELTDPDLFQELYKKAGFSLLVKLNPKDFTVHYVNLVNKIADILVNDLGIKPDLENGKFSSKMQEKFIIEIWGILKGNLLSITYGQNKYEMFWESLLTNQYDCDNLSFLIFDVANKIGLPIWLVVVPEHVLVRTEDFVFENTLGAYYPLKQLSDNYPLIYDQISINEIEKADAITLNTYALALFEKGHYPEALKCLDKAIKINPNYLDAYNNRGYVKMKLGDFEGAQEDLFKALKADELKPRIYANLGHLNYFKSNYKEALEYFMKAIELGIKDGILYNQIAITYYNLGENQLALKYFNEALNLAPSNPDIYYNRAFFYYNIGNFQEALKDLNKVIEINPDYINAYFIRMQIYRELGDIEKAIQDYKKIKELEKKNSN